MKWEERVKRDQTVAPPLHGIDLVDYLCVRQFLFCCSPSTGWCWLHLWVYFYFPAHQQWHVWGEDLLVWCLPRHREVISVGYCIPLQGIDQVDDMQRETYIYLWALSSHMSSTRLMTCGERHLYLWAFILSHGIDLVDVITCKRNNLTDICLPLHVIDLVNAMWGIQKLTDISPSSCHQPGRCHVRG